MEVADLRKQAKIEVMKEQFLQKVKSDNTYYLNFDTNMITGSGAANFQNIDVFLDGTGKDHIKNAKLSVVSFSIKGGGNAGFGTNFTAPKAFYLDISCLKSKCYKINAGRGATDNIMRENKLYPLINCEHYGTDDDIVANLFANRVQPEVACDNPFGKKLTIRLLNKDGVSLLAASTGGADAGDDSFALCLKVELLPDFNENDRINF